MSQTLNGTRFGSSFLRACFRRVIRRNAKVVRHGLLFLALIAKTLYTYICVRNRSGTQVGYASPHVKSKRLCTPMREHWKSLSRGLA